MYYIIVKDNEIYDKSQFKNLLEDVTNIEVTKEVFDNWERYIYRDGRIILDPDYDKKERQKEAERVGELTMTALDFITFLRQSGLSLEQIRAYLDNNIELDTQLKYCQNVYCKVVRAIFAEHDNEITIDNVTITTEMVEQAFKAKNGEVELIPEDEIPF